MLKLDRFVGNPVLSPNLKQPWEAEAAFNGSIIGDGSRYYLLYRAQGRQTQIQGQKLELSTIGCAQSTNRVEFYNRQQFIIPEYEWELFGCEDPRITFFEDNFYTFYTALGSFPPKPNEIRVAVAISKNLHTVSEKHLVTPFNAKAMAMFPQRINGKIAVIFTAHTDMPPAKIGIALFDDISQMWDPKYWEKWHIDIEQHSLPLLRTPYDQVEVGAAPIYTPHGWLLIYCYIRNYLTSNKIFGIEALLLDVNDPHKILGRTEHPLLTPETDYELNGKIPNVIFPSSAIVYNNYLGVYYGAADTSVGLATCSLQNLLEHLTPPRRSHTFSHESSLIKRFNGNPIISPILEHSWEDQYTFNPAAIYLKNKVHILYRAMGKNNVSVLGYAASLDGLHIDERLKTPAYTPREDFERKLEPGFSGCEDPRLTQIGDKIYMCYTAYDGKNPTRVALTSISVDDFCAKNWNWSKPQLISPPGMNDKNTCVLPEKINGKYCFLHRIHHRIYLDYKNDLSFKNNWLEGKVIMQPKPGTWYSEKIGIGPPPIKTSEGWLLIFHGLSKEDLKYRLGAALLKLDDPSVIISLLEDPILEPSASYENSGFRPGTVFACGAVVVHEQIYIYYGGADQVVCVATLPMASLLKELSV